MTKSAEALETIRATRDVLSHHSGNDSEMPLEEMAGRLLLDYEEAQRQAEEARRQAEYAQGHLAFVQHEFESIKRDWATNIQTIQDARHALGDYPVEHPDELLADAVRRVVTRKDEALQGVREALGEWPANATESNLPLDFQVRQLVAACKRAAER
jgi:hypothetical protein